MSSKCLLALLMAGLTCLPFIACGQNMAELWQKAEHGDVKAQYDMGAAYYVDKDYQEAIRWFRLAAEQGDAYAQLQLGELFSSGKNIPQDYAEAAKWLRLAAEQGQTKAQSILGDFYNSGKGVPLDSEEASKWYRLAAEHGDAQTQYKLSKLYAFGRGVQQNPAEAMKWRRLAVAQVHAELMDNTIAEFIGPKFLKKEWFITKFFMPDITQRNAYEVLTTWRAVFEQNGTARSYFDSPESRLQWLRMEGSLDVAEFEVAIQQASERNGVEISVKASGRLARTLSKEQAVDEATVIYDELAMANGNSSSGQARTKSTTENLGFYFKVNGKPVGGD